MITNNANVNGFLNVLEAARLNGVKRVVYASSSSVYGDSKSLPKVESKIGPRMLRNIIGPKFDSRKW